MLDKRIILDSTKSKSGIKRGVEVGKSYDVFDAFITPAAPSHRTDVTINTNRKRETGNGKRNSSL